MFLVFLCKTLCCHSASLHPGVYFVTGELNAGVGLEILSVTS